MNLKKNHFNQNVDVKKFKQANIMYKLSVQILVYNFFLCEQMLEIWEFVLILVGAEAFVGIVAGIFFWRKHVDKKYNIMII